MPLMQQGLVAARPTVQRDLTPVLRRPVEPAPRQRTSSGRRATIMNYENRPYKMRVYAVHIVRNGERYDGLRLRSREH